MFTNLSVVQINRLAQRLSKVLLGRSASVAAAAERFERLLAARIGADRAPKATWAILTAPGFETAAGRLAAEIDACEPGAPAELAPWLDPEPAVEAGPMVEAIPVAPEPAAAPRAAAGMPVSRPRQGRVNCPRRRTSPPRPMPASGPNWPRWWNWP